MHAYTVTLSDGETFVIQARSLSTAYMKAYDAIYTFYVPYIDEDITLESVEENIPADEILV